MPSACGPRSPNIGTPTIATAYRSPQRRTCQPKGITSYSTVNLSDWPMYVDGREHETRVEIAGSAPNQIADFGKAVSTAAFCVINQKWPCHPGVIYPDVLAMYHMPSDACSCSYRSNVMVAILERQNQAHVFHLQLEPKGPAGVSGAREPTKWRFGRWMTGPWLSGRGRATPAPSRNLCAFTQTSLSGRLTCSPARPPMPRRQRRMGSSTPSGR